MKCLRLYNAFISLCPNAHACLPGLLALPALLDRLHSLLPHFPSLTHTQLAEPCQSERAGDGEPSVPYTDIGVGEIAGRRQRRERVGGQREQKSERESAANAPW